MIRDNLNDVRKKIEDSCKKSGRNIEEVTLIAVSKTKPVEYIEEAIECDQQVFGENKVQELCDKMEYFDGKNLKWHMIGHLQTNKVKYIVGKVELIHSVDSFHLAKAIHDESVKKGVVTNILIEVNMAKEDTKFGCMAEDTEKLIKEISVLSGVKIVGLMTIAPYVDDAEENRSIFSSMKKLFVDINDKKIDNVTMNVLSMGMTGDYTVAVEEGATMVRVGTGIFGERDYSIGH